MSYRQPLESRIELVFSVRLSVLSVASEQLSNSQQIKSNLLS